MSHLSNLFMDTQGRLRFQQRLVGPIDEPPNHVMFRGYTLCRACSRALHAQHEKPCMCDICEEEAA